MTHSHGHAPFDADHMAAMLTTEAELASGLTAAVISRCAALLAQREHPVARIVDLGCGPGVAACALAAAFPTATVVAADGSPTMLARTAERAARLGLADRVEPVEVDLDGDLHALGAVSLVWSAQALHHARDEAATLASFASLLEPGGLLCLLERGEPTLLQLDTDLGRSGLWERVRAAQLVHAARTRHGLPGADDSSTYAALVASAGLEVVVSEVVTDTVVGPEVVGTDDAAARYFHRTARDLVDLLDAADIEALRAAPTAGAGVTVTSSRTLVIAT